MHSTIQTGFEYLKALLQRLQRGLQVAHFQFKRLQPEPLLPPVRPIPLPDAAVSSGSPQNRWA